MLLLNIPQVHRFSVGNEENREKVWDKTNPNPASPARPETTSRSAPVQQERENWDFRDILSKGNQGLPLMSIPQVYSFSMENKESQETIWRQFGTKQTQAQPKPSLSCSADQECETISRRIQVQRERKNADFRDIWSKGNWKLPLVNIPQVHRFFHGK